jgi:hypothetical protein
MQGKEMDDMMLMHSSDHGDNSRIWRKGPPRGVCIWGTVERVNEMGVRKLGRLKMERRVEVRGVTFRAGGFVICPE